MKNNFYTLSLLLISSCFNSIAQNCTTPTLENQQLCLPDTYTFQGGQGKIAVYNTADTSVISINTSVMVSPSVTTSYLYAQTDQVGPVDHTIGAGDFYTTVDKYVSFKVNHDLIINTLDVYPQNAGDITIRLVKMGGFLNLSETLIESRTVTVSSGGFQTVSLDLFVPQGDNYRLVLTSESCGGLFRNSAGQAFPYTAPTGSLEITGGDYSFMGYYYYFYNWNFTPVSCIKSLEINVNSAPTATASLTGNGIQADEQGMNYQWIDCAANEPVPGATSQQFTPSSSGQYAVVVSNGGCETTSDCILFSTGTTGIADISGHSFRIYPNPAVDKLFIETDEQIENIRIVDYKGQVVTNVAGAAMIDVSNLNAGIYFIELTTRDGGVTASKIVKQ